MLEGKAKTPHKAKGSKKGRKIGKGKRKVVKSHFQSYAGIIGASQARKATRLAARIQRLRERAQRRVCKLCKASGFRNKRAFVRHRKRCGREEILAVA